jgi:hypothetical protein
MSPLTGEPQLETLSEPGELGPDDVRSQVWEVLAGLSSKVRTAEQRRDNRYPFPRLVYLTPVATDGITPQGKNLVVVGKHLSERGLGFYHPQPLPYRRMIVSMETHDGQWLSFLIDLKWCRFNEQGWYESGGRFLKAVPPPFDFSH